MTPSIQCESNALKVLADKNLLLYLMKFASGCPYFVREFLEKVTCSNIFSLFPIAIQHENWKVADWLHLHYPENCDIKPFGNYAFAGPEWGRLSTVQWLHKNLDTSFKQWIMYMDIAASEGKFDIVQFLHTNRLEGCTTHAMDGAAVHGHLDIVKFLHENRTEGCTTEAIDYASYTNRIEVIQWLHSNRNEGCTKLAMELAAEAGNLDLLKWFHINHIPGFTQNAMVAALQQEQYHVVSWLQANRSEVNLQYAFDKVTCYQSYECIYERKKKLDQALGLQENHIGIGTIVYNSNT